MTTPPLEDAPLDAALARWLVDHVTAQIAVIGRDLRYRHANPALLAALGLPADRVIGRPLAEVLGAGAARYLRVREQLDRGEAIRWEGWVDGAADGPRYLQETLLPYRPAGAAGTASAMVVFGRDQTALKTHERQLATQLRELRASEALKSAIVDHALAALVSTDEDGRIVEFNPAAETMFGHERDAVLGCDVGELIVPERHRAAHRAGLARLRAGGETRALGKRLQLHGLRADGSEFPLEMVLWRTGVGSAAFYTASMVDTTERQQASEQIRKQREALRQGEKLAAMGSLLAGVAHELNNPLAIVLGRANLLEEKLAGRGLEDDVGADLRRIREAAERCGRIVRTFLDLARARPAERSTLDLNGLVAAAADMLQYSLSSHGITLELALGQPLPAVVGEADPLGQVVLNLLVSAQQALAAAAPPRRIRIATGALAAPAGTVWLRVADNGPGIAADVRRRLFEPFFTTRTEAKGTGLGLAMARTIAREHGGDLVLEPSAAGASFLLSLPAGPAAADEAGAAATAEALRTLHARVLVVDDEPELAALMRDMLEAAGYEVAIAESGAVALELLAAARFDAVLCDLRMPQMDGETLWREGTAAHPRLARRFVFVTGDTLSPGARGFLQESGCTRLDKPFGKAQLLNAMHCALAGAGASAG